MDQLESVFFEAHPMEWTQLKIEDKKLKIGEVFQLANNTLTLICVHCSQDFQYFTEFSLHIQEHYLRGDIADLGEIRPESPPAICNKSFKQHSEESPELICNETPTEPFQDQSDACSVVSYGNTNDSVVVENEVKSETIQNENPDDDDDDDDDDYDDDDKDAGHFSDSSDSTNEKHVEEFQKPFETIDNLRVPSEQFKFVEGRDYLKVDRRFQCLTCNRIAERFDHFKEHLLTHFASKDIYCPICGKAFITVAYVRKHVNQTHKQKYTGAMIREVQSKINVKLLQAASTTNNLSILTINKAIEQTTSPSIKSNQTEYKSFLCSVCGKSFNIPRYVQKHMRCVHGKFVSIQSIVQSQANLQNHQNVTDEIKVDSKPKVEAIKSISKESINKNENDTDKDYECYDCHKRFKSLHSLRKHLHLHSGIRYACPECQKLFAQKCYVLDHMSICHGITRKQSATLKIRQTVYNAESNTRNIDITGYECYLCKKTGFSTKIRLRYHMKAHLMGPFLCMFCGSICKSHDSLRHHMERHKADPNARVQCTQCDKTFQTKRYMLRHIRRTHSNVRKPKKVISQEKDERTFDCNECGRKYNSDHRLQQHMMIHNRKYYVCDVCGWEFKERRNLKIHMEVHSNEKNTNCTVCGKTLSIRYMPQHMLIHDGSKEHQCATCGMQFVTAQRLKRHMIRHTRQLKYACDLCDKKYITSDKLLDHRRKSHSEKMPHTCTVCNKGFFSIKSLRKHANSHYLEGNPIQSFIST